VDLNPLMNRIGSARIVLLGEAPHGTSEFYRMRERISRELIIKKGFCFISIEADWPDAARVDHYVRHFQYPPSEWTAFARFPTWMWRNNEVRDFVSWLRKYNDTVQRDQRVAFHGLDLYSLYVSIRSVLNYLDEVDPDSAKVARERCGCLTPWQRDPATYGHAALTGSYPTCEKHVVRTLTDLLDKRRAYAEHDGERFLDACRTLVWSQTPSATTASSTTARVLPGICAIVICLRLCKPCSRSMGRTAKPSCGRTILISATQARLKCPPAASTTSATCAAKSSANKPTWSAAAPTAEQLLPRLSGAGLWR
jgi:erythromycin esterase-like protein